MYANLPSLVVALHTGTLRLSVGVVPLFDADWWLACASNRAASSSPGGICVRARGWSAAGVDVSRDLLV